MDMNNDDMEDKEKEENLNGIPVAEDEPIYAISDFEGRYDYYIRFLMDIGFLDKEKLKKIIIDNCQNKKDKEICNAFFNGNPEEFLIDVIYDDKHNENEKQKYIQQNKTRLEWLMEHCTAEKILQARNENFKGKIVVNGDLYSNRIMLLLMNYQEYKNLPNGERTISCKEVKQLITDVNTKCLDLIFELENQLNIERKNKKIFLIAGNHDLYECDFISRKLEDCLQNVKNLSLKHVHLLKFVKFKIGDKTIVFKHSPYLSQDALDTIKRKKDREIQDESIRKYPDEPFKTKHSYYWKYANNSWSKEVVDKETIFCNNEQDNEKINQQLKENNYYMVFGHCGITASNSLTFSIIDKDWDKYQYSKFSIDKKQLKHEVYGAKNQIIKTYNIQNFKKAKRRDEKFNNNKLSIASNNEIYFQKQKKQKKNFDVLEVARQENFSINNNGLKKEQSTQTENKIECSKRIELTYDGVNSSNSVCGLNACCNWIGNTCG